MSLEADRGQLATTPEQRQPQQPIAQALALYRPRPQAMSKRGVQGTSVRLPTVVLDAYPGGLPVSQPLQALEITRRERHFG